MIFLCRCFDVDETTVSSLSVTIKFFPLSPILADMKFYLLQKFNVLDTIQLEDCGVILGFGQRNTGVEALL